MRDSLLRSLYSLLDSGTAGSVADFLCISQQSTLQGLKSGIAAVLGGMLGKSEEPNALRAVLELSPTHSGEGSPRQFAREAFDPNTSPLLAGRHILSALFGASQATVTDAVGAASGLLPGDAATILSMTAPVVTSFIANRVRAEGMNMHDLGQLLQDESGIIRNALPAGLEHLFGPPAVKPSAPASGRSVERERRTVDWLPLVAMVALAPALVWLFSHARRVTGPEVAGVPPIRQTLGGARRQRSTEQPATGAANRVETDPVEAVRRLLVNRVDLRFDTGSATLRRESRRQLGMIVSTIAMYPDVHLTLTGHTDNTGGAGANRRLSRRRADTVVAELIRKGVPPDHLSSESQDRQGTIADNSTEEGRSRNRCVTLDVSEH